jgi:hypothetical protein
MTPEQDAALAQLKAVSIDPKTVAETPPVESFTVIDPKHVAQTAASSVPPNARPAVLNRYAGEVVKPVGQEQLERSEKMIRDFGTPHKYMASLDQRDPDDIPRSVVPGVGFTPVPDQRANPSLYPENWVTMTEDERGAWAAAHPATSIDPHKVAQTQPRESHSG